MAQIPLYEYLIFQVIIFGFTYSNISLVKTPARAGKWNHSILEILLLMC